MYVCLYAYFSHCERLYLLVRSEIYYVMLNQISLVCKVYYKYQKQTLLQKYLDHHYYVVMPLHDGQVGFLPPSGRPPTRQVSPAGCMFLCSPYLDQ